MSQFSIWTEVCLGAYGHSPKEVLWVGTPDGQEVCSWEEFCELPAAGSGIFSSNIGNDDLSGYGSVWGFDSSHPQLAGWRCFERNEILRAGLVVAGDGWWMELRPRPPGSFVWYWAFVVPPVWEPEHRKLKSLNEE